MSVVFLGFVLFPTDIRVLALAGELFLVGSFLLSLPVNESQQVSK